MVPDIFSEFNSLPDELASVLVGLLVILLAIVVIYLLSILANYIMTSIALCRIGQRRGIKQPWLIWIPIVRNYAVGALADEYDARNGIKRRFRVILLVFVLLYYAINIAWQGISLSIIDPISALDYVDAENFEEFIPIVFKALGTLYGGLIGMILCSLVFSGLYFVCLYKIFESLTPRFCVLHIALSIIIPFYQPICLLCLRNKGYPYPEATPALPEAETVEKGWYQE